MNYSYHYSGPMDDDVISLIVYVVCTLLLGGGKGLITYIFRSLGVYGIAKRRGLNRPWLAWIPVADHWLLGCVSDQYQYVVKDKNTNRRKWLLGLRIALLILSVAVSAAMLGVAFEAIEIAMAGGNVERAMMPLVRKLLTFAVWLVPLMGVSVAEAVFYYMSTYDLYRSTDPRNSVIYLVISIFFRITEPFFIFFNRNRDDGMPPRKAAPVTEEPPVWEPYEEASE